MAADNQPDRGGGISSEEKQAQRRAVNDWLEAHGLPRGILSHDLSDSDTDTDTDTDTSEQKTVAALA